MHSRASVREEAAHRGVVVERAEQLEPALSDPDGGCLDPLLRDTGTLFQLGPEEALVRLERTVQIFHGEAYMVHGAGRVHAAIVCERLAPTMRVSAFALVLVAVLLAGCGSGKKAAKPNGEASRPPARVLADARRAATGASSAHVSGKVVGQGTTVKLDLALVRGKGATGSMSTNGLKFDLVRIGDTAYIHGSDAFYRHFAPPVFAQLLHGKWVKASTAQGRFHSIDQLTSLDALFGQVSSHHGRLVNAGATTYNGEEVVELRDTSDGSRLYVAAAGKPYPVAIVGGKTNASITLTFDRWNASVTLTAPKGAIDVSRFGG
jgi:hypothetical protein